MAVLFSGMADATHIPFAELHGIVEMEYARVHENERRPVTIANIYSITIGKAVPTNSSFERIKSFANSVGPLQRAS